MCALIYFYIVFIALKAIEKDCLYLGACALVKCNMFEQAYMELNVLIVKGETRSNPRKLKAYVATKLADPQDEDAVAEFTSLISENPETMKLVTNNIIMYFYYYYYYYYYYYFNLLLYYPLH
jgi:hypothetical protein